MKLKFTLALVILSFSLFAQVPGVINYQGVIRGATGDPLLNSTVAIQFRLLQGSSTGSAVLTETTSVQTGSLGVFSTQIGKSLTQPLSLKNGPYFLEVGVDLNNGSNFTTLGVQQMVSVPFAFRANSVPTSYTNNILQIGTDTIALHSYTSGTGIGIQSGSVIVNTLPDQTVSIDPGNGNVQVSGSYPNFSISATPSLSLLSPNTLSISEGNSVTIAPSLTFSNNVLTVGPASNSLSLPIPPATSLVGTGAAQVATLGANSYSIDVPQVSVVQGSNVTVNGSFPNYTVNANPTLSLLSPNSLSISGGNSVAISPSLGIVGNTLSVGPSTNFIAIPVPTVQSQGAAIVTPSTGLSFLVNVPVSTLVPSGGGISISSPGTNSFNLTVPAATLSNGSNVNVSGIHPNFTVNATPTLSLLSPNTLSVSFGNTVPIAPSLAFTNNVLTVGPSFNTVTIPSSTTSLVGSGLAAVSVLGPNSFSVDVAVPQYTGGANVQVSGIYPNLVFSATPTLVLNTNTLSITGNPGAVVLNNYTVGAGLVMSGGPNYTISATAVTPSIVGTRAATVNPSSGNSFTVDVPFSSVTATSGIATVSSPGTNSFNVNVPAATYNQSTGNLTQGSAVTNITQTLNFSGNVLTVGAGNNTVSIPPTSNTITGTGIATVTPATGNNFVVDVPSPTFTGSGITTVTGAYPNYTVTTPATSATITGTGAATVTPSTGLNFNVDVPFTQVTSTAGIATVTATGTNSYNVNVPAPSYNAASGVLTQGSTNLNILPLLGISGNTLSSGIASNSVQIPQAAITGSNAVSVTQSGNSFTVDAPFLNINAVGGSSMSGVYPNFTVVTQTTSLTPAGAVSVTGAFPNYTVSAPVTTVTGTGLAVVTPTSGSGFVVDVPALTYVPSSGVLSSGSNTVTVAPTVAYASNILSVGPGSNSVSVIGSPFIQNANTVTLVTASSSVGIGTSAPVSPLDISGTTNGVFNQAVFSQLAVNTTVPGANLASGRFYTQYSGSGSPQLITGLNARVDLGSGANISQYPAGAWLNASNISNGTHNNAIGVFGTIQNTGAGTITNGYGGYFDHLGSTNITNGYGVFTGAIAGTNKWSFYASDASASNYFAGKTGIGTNAPSENLQVQAATTSQVSLIGSSAGGGQLSFGDTGNHFQGNIVYDNTADKFNFWTNNTPNKMTLDVNGNLGLNTASTSGYNLSIFGTGTGSSIRLNNSGSSSLGLVLEGNTAAASINNYENTSLHFATNGINRMTITSGGNVGIGVSTPISKLQIESANSTVHLYDSPTFLSTILTSEHIGKSGNAPQVRFNTNPSPNYIDIGQNTSGDFVIEGNDNPRMVVTNAGNVGIGVTVPAANLHVSGSMRVVDGNQGTNKVLTSDASGNATWQPALAPGMVIAYAGNSIPSGWLLCDGTPVSRVTYSSLFAALGTTWGSGDGSTTFNLPDMRGMFLRGVSAGSGNDPDAASRFANNAGGNTGNTVGTEQSHQIQSHSHSIPNMDIGGAGLLGTSVWTPGSTHATNATGGNETRPKNVYVYYIIKQ